MAQETTKESEQAIMNKSFDPTYNVEQVEGVGYDGDASVLRPIAVDANGKLKVTT